MATPHRRASDAQRGKDGKRRSSLASKAAEKAYERHEEAWFNFHRYDTDNSGTIDVNELGHLLSDLKMHVARASRSEEQMAAWVKAEVKKNDAMEMASFHSKSFCCIIIRCALSHPTPAANSTVECHDSLTGLTRMFFRIGSLLHGTARNAKSSTTSLPRSSAAAPSVSLCAARSWKTIAASR